MPNELELERAKSNASGSENKAGSQKHKKMTVNA